MAKAAEQIYSRSPLWAKTMLLNAQAYKLHRRRYDGSFKSALGDVLQREHFDRDSIGEFQRARLRNFIRTAGRTQYWSRVFNNYGVDFDSDADPFELLRKLPLLDKAEVQQHLSEFQNPDVSKSELIHRQTSGTTGAGLRFVETARCEQETWAVWWRYRFRHGIELHQKCGYFGGRTVIPARTGKPPFWINNRVWNQLLFSAYHLSPRNAEHYAAAIKSHGVEWMHGYPSMISLLAGFMQQRGIEPVESVRNITFGAESVSERQKSLVREMFPRAALSEHYGLAEGVANISQCERGTLHVDEDFAFVEFIEVDGIPDVYEVAGTNWSNEAFPLFRYRTGDLVQIDEARCGCGRETRVVREIDGRREDAIALPNGRVVGRMDHIFKDMVNIVEAQIHQTERSRIELHIVKSARYSRADEQKLKNNLAERLGDAMGIEFVYTDRLPRPTSGKLKFVVSHLPDAQIARIRA